MNRGHSYVPRLSRRLIRNRIPSPRLQMPLGALTNSPHSPGPRPRRKMPDRGRARPLDRLSATSRCAPARTARLMHPVVLTSHTPAARGAFASDRPSGATSIAGPARLRHGTGLHAPKRTRRAAVRCPARNAGSAPELHGRFSFTSSSGADHGYGSIFISAASSTRGPTPLGQK
jgi:hypothetical protein